MLNQFADAPFSLILILLNLLIGIYSLAKDPSLVPRMAMTPIRIRENGEYYRFLTGGFVHAGGMHLAFNVFTLFFFGPPIEGRLGPYGFLLVYLVSGIAANVVAYFVHRRNDRYSAVGSSGSIAGVLFGFCLFWPTAQIVVLVIPMPAWIFALAFIGFSVYAMVKRPGGELGRIAHEAHLGGALAGFILTMLLEPDALGLFFRNLGL